MQHLIYIFYHNICSKTKNFARNSKHFDDIHWKHIFNCDPYHNARKNRRSTLLIMVYWPFDAHSWETNELYLNKTNCQKSLSWMTTMTMARRLIIWYRRTAIDRQVLSDVSFLERRKREVNCTVQITSSRLQIRCRIWWVSSLNCLSDIWKKKRTTTKNYWHHIHMLSITNIDE